MDLIRASLTALIIFTKTFLPTSNSVVCLKWALATNWYLNTLFSERSYMSLDWQNATPGKIALLFSISLSNSYSSSFLHLRASEYKKRGLVWSCIWRMGAMWEECRSISCFGPSSGSTSYTTGSGSACFTLEQAALERTRLVCDAYYSVARFRSD